MKQCWTNKSNQFLVFSTLYRTNEYNTCVCGLFNFWGGQGNVLLWMRLKLPPPPKKKVIQDMECVSIILSRIQRQNVPRSKMVQRQFWYNGLQSHHCIFCWNEICIQPAELFTHNCMSYSANQTNEFNLSIWAEEECLPGHNPSLHPSHCPTPLHSASRGFFSGHFSLFCEPFSVPSLSFCFHIFCQFYLLLF